MPVAQNFIAPPKTQLTWRAPKMRRLACHCKLDTFDINDTKSCLIVVILSYVSSRPYGSVYVLNKKGQGARFFEFMEVLLFPTLCI